MTELEEHPAADERFFAALPEIAEFARVTEPDLYTDAPSSWWLVLSDVRGSTRAIEEGRYRDVNALGVASIVALCNALPELDLPYVFGGDGATLLLPGSRMAAARAALRGVRRLAREAFDLDLRVGAVPLGELYAAGCPVRVARFRASPQVCLAMFAGNGLLTAERWVKDPASGARYQIDERGPAEANLEGFECRWQPVRSRRGAIVSLLVLALPGDAAARSHAYAALLAELSAIVGDDDAHPLSARGLKLGGPFSDYSTEAALRAGSASGPEFERARKHARTKALIGRGLIALRAEAGGFDGASYPRELVQNTDFRKFDETLRMVLDLSPEQLRALEAALERQRAGGQLVYGLHRAGAALVTCLVRSYQGNHVHFVDGAEGGYALAAKQLKAQLRATAAA